MTCDNRRHQYPYACADYHIITPEYEGGMPRLSLAETMISSLSCIVSDIPELATVIDADCRKTFNYGDVSMASVQMLNYLLNISNERSEHSRNAKGYVLDQLDWYLISEQYPSVFGDYVISGDLIEGNPLHLLI